MTILQSEPPLYATSAIINFPNDYNNNSISFTFKQKDNGSKR